tara:strand:+ start:398 stop:673 length:276 start_codon:yes stop_codon:yes gene_type:complete
MIGTRNKAINDKINNIKDNRTNIFWFKREKINTINIPIITKIKCFKKKWYEFVSSLSDAIIDVETREKNNPKVNNIETIKKIDLSIFFQQS